MSERGFEDQLKEGREERREKEGGRSNKKSEDGGETISVSTEESP